MGSFQGLLCFRCLGKKEAEVSRKGPRMFPTVKQSKRPLGWSDESRRASPELPPLCPGVWGWQSSGRQPPGASASSTIGPSPLALGRQSGALPSPEAAALSSVQEALGLWVRAGAGAGPTGALGQHQVKDGRLPSVFSPVSFSDSPLTLPPVFPEVAEVSPRWPSAVCCGAAPGLQPQLSHRAPGSSSPPRGGLSGFGFSPPSCSSGCSSTHCRI